MKYTRTDDMCISTTINHMIQLESDMGPLKYFIVFTKKNAYYLQFKLQEYIGIQWIYYFFCNMLQF